MWLGGEKHSLIRTVRPRNKFASCKGVSLNALFNSPFKTDYLYNGNTTMFNILKIWKQIKPYLKIFPT